MHRDHFTGKYYARKRNYAGELPRFDFEVTRLSALGHRFECMGDGTREEPVLVKVGKNTKTDESELRTIIAGLGSNHMSGWGPVIYFKIDYSEDKSLSERCYAYIALCADLIWLEHPNADVRSLQEDFLLKVTVNSVREQKEALRMWEQLQELLKVES